MTHAIVQADAIDFLHSQPEGSLDLVFGSPPYEQARLYLEGGTNMGISRKTATWVAWMADVHEAAQRACKGLVAFVVAGQTRNYRWSAGPALYMAELHRRGLNLRNPPIFSRVGIPGSGGPDWLRADYEWIICTSRPGKLPWSDNTAAGHPPKWAPGGAMSHRVSDGTRTNQWGKTGTLTGTTAKGNKEEPTIGKPRPSHKTTSKRLGRGSSPAGEGSTKGTCAYKLNGGYDPPTLANPGNILHLNVGGGTMGHNLAHVNEAPFPEKLAEFFVLSFCPPGGTACDPFSGSGTTAAVAKQHGRNFAGCDLRQSQVDLGLKRLATVTPSMFSG